MEGQLVIKFGPNGVELFGPIDNQVLCYGLLEVARDLVASQAAKKAMQRVMSADDAMRPMSARLDGVVIFQSGAFVLYPGYWLIITPRGWLVSGSLN